MNASDQFQRIEDMLVKRNGMPREDAHDVLDDMKYWAGKCLGDGCTNSDIAVLVLDWVAELTEEE